MSDRIMEWLDESQRLADQATEGPWEWDSPGEVSQHWSRPKPWETVVSTEVACMAHCYGGTAQGIEREEDGEFIAEARTRFPQAVAALRAVMDLHRPLRDARDWSRRCGECEQPWPCLTVQEVRVALGLEGDDDE